MKTVDVLCEITRLQEEALRALLEVIRRERAALRDNEPASLPALLSELQDVASEAMRVEAQRVRVSETLAGELGCPPKLTDICEALSSEEGARLREVSLGLVEVVTSLKEENFVLSKQAQEHRHLGEMVLERLRVMKMTDSGSGFGLDARA